MLNIIIPYYKSENTLRKTLDSLVAQTQQKFIITIVDDCSEDNFRENIREYNEKLRINYLKTKENGGPGVARQVGLDKTNCDYVLFLDADDMLLPNAVEVLSREAHSRHPDILISSFIQQNRYIGDRVISAEESTTWLHGKVYKVSFLRENNIRFCEKIRLNEDGNFNHIAYSLAKDMYKINIPTVLWVDNKNSLTRSDDKFFENCIPDYIIGQTEAMLFLINQDIITEKKIASTITLIYHYLQIRNYKGIITEKYVKEELKNFFNNNKIKGLFSKKEFKKIIQESLCERNNIKGKDYFETETFMSWISKYGINLKGEN